MIHDNAMEKGLDGAWSQFQAVLRSVGHRYAGGRDLRQIAGAGQGRAELRLTMYTRDSVEYVVRLTLRTCWGTGIKSDIKKRRNTAVRLLYYGFL
jgi:hypothetical protein